jgi:hypothetical protein
VEISAVWCMVPVCDSNEDRLLIRVDCSSNSCIGEIRNVGGSKPRVQLFCPGKEKRKGKVKSGGGYVLVSWRPPIGSNGGLRFITRVKQNDPNLRRLYHSFSHEFNFKTRYDSRKDKIAIISWCFSRHGTPKEPLVSFRFLTARESRF